MRKIRTQLVWIMASMTLVVLTAGNLHAVGAKSMLGQKLPPLAVQYLGDEPDITNKPVVLEFWATWCPPCRQSIPHLNEIYRKYKEKGLVVIGVSDEKGSTIKKFMKEVPIDYYVARDSKGRLNDTFQIRGIPHAVLVNAQGIIVWEGHPLMLQAADIEKILE